MKIKPNWNTSDIPSQIGKIAVVTGTGGLGYETALALAQAGAEVILAGRSESKGRDSVDKILQISPVAKITFEKLDLADLNSVAEFAKRFSSAHPFLDVLINNAGVMAIPQRETTADGFEKQFGTNYLGHFALTARLLPRLGAAQHPRVVSLSSIAHRSGAIHFDDLQFEKNYDPWKVYQQSKLAMLMFAFELQRRSDANKWGIISEAAHPGFARTDLIEKGPGTKGLLMKVSRIIQPLVSHSAAAGALPTLYAATSPDAKGGQYYGPHWFMELKGSPKVAEVKPQANDLAVAKKLWEVSEALTGVKFWKV